MKKEPNMPPKQPIKINKKSSKRKNESLFSLTNSENFPNEKLLESSSPPTPERHTHEHNRLNRVVSSVVPSTATNILDTMVTTSSVTQQHRKAEEVTCVDQ
jgi:hypothetical protein